MGRALNIMTALSASLHEHPYGENHDYDNNYDLDYILEHVSLSVGSARRPQHMFVGCASTDPARSDAIV